MSKSRALSLTLIMTTALTIGACSDKDKPRVENPLDSVKASVLSKPGIVDFKALMAVSARKTNDATSEAVLKALGLWEQSDTLTWASRTGANGTYTFRDLSQISKHSDSGDTVTLTLGTLTLTGLHEVDGEANFDRMDMKNVKALHSNGNVKIERATVSRPSPALASEILSKITDLSNLSDLNATLALDSDDDHSVGAMALTGVDITAPDANISLSSLHYGEDETSGKISFEVDSVRIKGQTNYEVLENGKSDIPLPVNISIDKAFVYGLNNRKLDGPGGAIAKFTPNMNQTFDRFLIDNLDIEYDGLYLFTDSLEAQSVKKDDIITVTQVMDPLTVNFKSDPKSYSITAFKDLILNLGYKSLTFDMQQKSELNIKTDNTRIYDSYIKMNDGFIFNYNYNISGINALQTIAASGRKDATEDAISAITLNSGTLSLTDNSILDRIFKMLAEEQGISENVLKMQAKSVLMLGSLGAKSKEDGKVITNFAGAIGAFIDAGGTLDIAFKPEAPLSLDSLEGLQNGQTPLSKLGLTASARKAE